MPRRQRDLIIHDGTPARDFEAPGKGKGLDLSRRPVGGYAYGDAADPFPASMVIPRSEWQARIQELEETRTRISDLCDLRGLKVKDQKSTSYCWINATTHSLEITRCVQNEPYVELSAAGAGSKITGFRNVGGYGRDAVVYLSQSGCPPVSFWPVNAIDRRYDTPAATAAALKYRISEWWELEPGNLDQLISCLLMRTPIAVGLSWWSHEVTYVDPVWMDGTAAVRFDNSWGQQYGTNGRGILQGQRILPDDACAPRTAFASKTRPKMAVA